MQIAETIEDNILKGIFQEETAIPSTTEISVKYKINPATVAKGFNLLVDEGIIYKKRGVGMFVVTGSKDKLMEKRKEDFYENYIVSLIEEAKKLNISSSDIIKMIEGGI
ncbi:GntR family transcriptional regulator [Clostridium estertheticum]|uniref:GntR family transcriptional regulator n=1 Tax=Clostridium estertheticum TaxID=238834 RepID=A0A5N7IL65_9CLOT|nr:GntR family transcriptional regulator [Clostridium estertheticum]MPQ31047.1 GntR family transcriptional regulator [Clostridium estertheticum]MPQ61723.1 GntR family transcriptional regulator [Clostridium estertheticum]